MQSEPLTIDGWLALVAEKKEVASVILENKAVSRQVWNVCGEAAEYLLKAYIMKVRRLNAWPERGELHIHDIRRLFGFCGIVTSNLSPKQIAAFLKAMEWSRWHDYQASPFPHSEARQMYDAVFGKEGVEEWIKTNL